MCSTWLLKLCSVFLVVASQIQFIGSTSIRDLLINSDYDSDVMPVLGANRPVNVNVTLQIVNFRSLEERDLSFTLDCFVYMTWEENRISLPYNAKKELNLNSKWLRIFWLPSIYFKNGISGNLHTGLFTTSYFVLRPLRNYGVNIFMASRISVTLLCDFDFKNFPHDSNRCNIDFMSLSERNDTLTLNWDLFKISKRVYNPDFAISDAAAEDCSANYSLGTYSCIRGTILITRNVRRHYLRKFFPTFLIVLTSFLGFFVPVTSYPARACILTISLLSLITQQIQSQPVRSMYTISYNVWSNACIGIVFFALIEFGWAIVWEEKIKIKREQDKLNQNVEANDLKKRKDKFSYKYSPNCNLIDSYARILFPLFFTLFIIFYIFYVSFRA